MVNSLAPGTRAAGIPHQDDLLIGYRVQEYAAMQRGRWRYLRRALIGGGIDLLQGVPGEIETAIINQQTAQRVLGNLAQRLTADRVQHLYVDLMTCHNRQVDTPIGDHRIGDIRNCRRPLHLEFEDIPGSQRCLSAVVVALGGIVVERGPVRVRRCRPRRGHAAYHQKP